MADIFISYTSSDRDWAFWIAHELEALGHVAHVHEWEIPGGGDIMAWMVKRHEEADHILCVVSRAYFDKPYSSMERLAAQWAAVSDRPGFALPVFIEDCKAPTLLAHIKRCDLYGLTEDEAGRRLTAFVAPVGRPTDPPRFPGGPSAQTPAPARAPVPFPPNVTLSNIPISVPRHFVGRDEALAAIAAALASSAGRAAVTALHGLRGVGKTTLAAAYADRHRGDYRATWWIRAQTPEGMRADLVALGVQLGWVAADEKEQPAFEATMARLREEGGRILLIYDSASNPDDLRSYLPLRGAVRILITSSAPNWRALAEPVEIRVWPKEIGADYLTARTGRTGERAAAEALSETLGGLPLALEQAAAYSEDIGVRLAEYQRRFDAAAAELLDDKAHAPFEYHRDEATADSDRLTVAGTFQVAVQEASKRHPAAEPLIEYAALLAPEPIPLFLFAEAREKFSEPLRSALLGDGLDTAIAALRALALVDRESIADERDPSITTDCIRLHRLVRQVAAGRCRSETRDAARRTLIDAIGAVYPGDVFNDPATWPRARRLDALALGLVTGTPAPDASEGETSHLLNQLAMYRYGALAAYGEARALLERALGISEKVFGPEHRRTASALNNLGLLLQELGERDRARSLYERALAIQEKVLGPEHVETGASLNNLAGFLQSQGDFAAARPLVERDLAITEKVLGPEHLDTTTSVNNLAILLYRLDDLTGARTLFERALASREKILGSEHPNTANSLDNLAVLLQAQGEDERAQSLYERALAIREKVLGPEHPDTASSLNNLASLLLKQGDVVRARPLFERALWICEKVLSPGHSHTQVVLRNLARCS